MSHVLQRVLRGGAQRIRDGADWLFGYRSLLWFSKDLTSREPRALSNRTVSARAVTLSEFAALPWTGNPWVFREALDFRGDGERRALCHFTDRDELLGFAWLESRTIDLRFFDCLMRAPDRCGYLSRVWIDPAGRGRGVGGTLLRAVETAAQQRDMQKLLGACVPTNEAMRRVFERGGWQMIGRIDRWHLATLSLFRLRSATRATSYRIDPGNMLVHLVTDARTGTDT